MDNIAQLTLELFMNKNAYNRYIEKTDPSKSQERYEYIINMKKYKDRILGITRRFIEDPDLQITVEMNDMFSDYCKTCIKYFELKDLEETCSHEREPEENTMFDPLQMTEYENTDDMSIKANSEASFCINTKAQYTAFINPLLNK